MSIEGDGVSACLHMVQHAVTKRFPQAVGSPRFGRGLHETLARRCRHNRNGELPNRRGRAELRVDTSRTGANRLLYRPESYLPGKIGRVGGYGARAIRCRALPAGHGKRPAQIAEAGCEVTACRPSHCGLLHAASATPAAATAPASLSGVFERIVLGSRRVTERAGLRAPGMHCMRRSVGGDLLL